MFILYILISEQHWPVQAMMECIMTICLTGFSYTNRQRIPYVNAMPWFCVREIKQGRSNVVAWRTHREVYWILNNQDLQNTSTILRYKWGIPAQWELWKRSWNNGQVARGKRAANPPPVTVLFVWTIKTPFFTGKDEELVYSPSFSAHGHLKHPTQSSRSSIALTSGSRYELVETPCKYKKVGSKHFTIPFSCYLS